MSWLLLAFGGLSSSAPAAEKRAPDPQAIAEVAAGKRTEARAAWWGFDPADATAALQAAINSGARKLVVEDMGAPWITDKLALAGGQEIVFEKGVEVLAKRGAFRNGNDSLFSANSKQNITLTGDGATLRMWKQDYDDKAQYKHAEWRHVLAFWSCAGVRITGLTLADSGGDGIYLGVAQKGVPCSDVVIKNVACVNNYRQGISVISARNLLIEDCVLKDTWGTAPQAGIDFEPNASTEELVNCVLRNVVSENNRGSAYAFYLPKLRAESKALSVKFENCRAVGCRSSVALTIGNDTETAAVKGAVEFNHCRFEGSENEAVFIRDMPVAGAKVSFVNCEIVNPAAHRPTITAIAFASRANCVNTIGGVRFSDCTITDAQDRLPMSYQEGAAGVGLGDITGTLIVKRGDQRTTHQLTPKLIDEWMPHRTFKKIAPYSANDSGYVPALPDSMPDAAQRSIARQRDLSEWLLWANAGEQVSFTVFVRPVGKGEAKPVPVSLISPSGKLTKLPAAQGAEKRDYEFKATERGAYTIVCDPQKWAATVNSATHRVCLYAPKSIVHFLGTTGRYFFWVPEGTKEFAIRVSGEGSAESVKAALFDPAGNAIEGKDNISQAHQFVAAPKDAAHGEIWSLQLDKPSTGVLEDCYVQLQGIPPLLSSTREGLLKPVK
jgi:hypothetical protein